MTLTAASNERASSWSPPSRRALTLQVGSTGRELSLREGRLWLTLTGCKSGPPADVWLLAGERLFLPPGARFVIEAWPQARFELLVLPEVRASRKPTLSCWRQWIGGKPRAQFRGVVLSV